MPVNNIKKYLGGILGPLLAAVMCALPTAKGLTPQSMQVLGLLLWLVIWLAFSVIPEYLTALTVLAVGIVMKLFTVKEAFSSFAGNNTWLLVGAFSIGICLNKTGLIKRIAYFIMKFFPETFKGQLLALFTAGAIVSPAMPSLTVKSTIICSLSRPAATAFGFTPGDKGTGGLFMAGYWSSGLLGNCFLTGSTFVGVIMELLPQAEHDRMTFFCWAGMSCVFFAVLFIGGLITVSRLYSPGEKTRISHGYVSSEMEKLGPMSRDENVVFCIFILVILGWLSSSYIGIPTCAIAVLGMVLLGGFGQFTAQDFAARIPWSTIVLISAITSFASLLSPFGIDKWLGSLFSGILGPLSSSMVFLLVAECALVFVIRLAVPSQYAAATITASLFMSMAQNIGVSQVVVLFIAYMGVQCWPFAGFNTTILASLAAVSGDVDYRSVTKMSYIYSALILFAVILSLPLWKAMQLV